MAKTTATAPTSASPATASKTSKHGATTATTSEGPRPNTLTLRLSRTIKAPPERIYQCFLDPDAAAKWLPPHGFTGKMHSIEPKVGGKFRMSFSTINRSWTHFFGGTYKELVPGKRIAYTNHFETDDPSMQGEMMVTIDLTKVPEGTRVDIVQAGIPKGPAADGSPIGWSQSLDNLAALCEQELPF